MSAPTPPAGGFMHPTLPSPAPSSPGGARLPHPRTQPLRAGSGKEEAARRYVDNQLLQVSRRYVKKFQPAGSEEAALGYTSMREVCRDLGEVIDVLWLSGTPSLQIPYLLNIALAVTSYMPAFPPAPHPTFSLLRKLDHAFASLLQGVDIVSGESLPGFQGLRGGMSRTDMVRCKSLVETTRVQVVEVMSKEPQDQTGDDTEAELTDVDAVNTGTDVEEQNSWDVEDDDEDGHEMDVARVYEKTIVQLGLALGGDTAYEAGAS